MDATTEALTPRLTPLGLVLAVAGGATAAGVMGFVYHQVANKAGIDFIIALAVIVGAAVGLAVGVASRLGGLRAMTVVAVVAFVFGVVGYAARYFFQFNEEVETIVQEVGADAQAARRCWPIWPTRIRPAASSVTCSSWPNRAFPSAAARPKATRRFRAAWRGVCWLSRR